MNFHCQNPNQNNSNNQNFQNNKNINRHKDFIQYQNYFFKDFNFDNERAYFSYAMPNPNLQNFNYMSPSGNYQDPIDYYHHQNHSSLNYQRESLDLEKRKYPFAHYPQINHPPRSTYNPYFNHRDYYLRRHIERPTQQTLYKFENINNFQMNFKIYKEKSELKNEKKINDKKKTNFNKKKKISVDKKKEIVIHKKKINLKKPKNNKMKQKFKEEEDKDEIEILPNEKKLDLIFNNWNYLTNKSQEKRIQIKNEIIDCFDNKLNKEKSECHKIGLKINFGFLNIQNDFNSLSILNKIQLFIYYFNKLVKSEKIINSFTGFSNFNKEVFPVSPNISSICE